LIDQFKTGEAPKSSGEKLETLAKITGETAVMQEVKETSGAGAVVKSNLESALLFNGHDSA